MLLPAGWRLWYEPRLQLQHFLTADRLHWRYLRKLRRGGGRATLGFDPYRFVLETCGQEHQISFWWNVSSLSESHPDTQIWQGQFMTTIKDLLSQPKALIKSLFRPMEGSNQALKVENLIGRLLQLLRERDTYDKNIRNIRMASWRKI
jgi:hypothetical protein